MVRWKVRTVESSFDVADAACELQQYSVIYQDSHNSIALLKCKKPAEHPYIIQPWEWWPSYQWWGCSDNSPV